MKKKEKPKVVKFSIWEGEPPNETLGLIDDNKIFWKKHIPCICNGINDLKNCRRCKYQDQENCLPRSSFVHLGKTINKINVMRGSDGDIYAIKY